MTVKEMQSHTDFTPRLIQACPVGHGAFEHVPRELGRIRQSGAGSTGLAVRVSAAARVRPPTRPEDRRAGMSATADRVRPAAGVRVGAVRSEGPSAVAPGRRVLPRSSVRARACHVEAPSPAGVVDDVPTWALLVCGILVGVLMLLALAFLGGPAYG